jgi:hypothetical protein
VASNACAIGWVVVGHFVATRIKFTAKGRFHPFLHAGNCFLRTGNRSLHAGNRLPRVRRRSLRMGYCSLRTGNRFLHVGNRSLRVGNRFLRTGNHLLRMGNSFLRMGRRSLHAILPVIEMCKRQGARGERDPSRSSLTRPKALLLGGRVKSYPAAEDAGFMSAEP